MEREPFAVMGVSESAPWSEVRAAYRALARQYHPDGSTPEAARMAAINAAYETLERRRRAGEPRHPAMPIGPGPVRPASAGPPPGSLLWRMNRARHVDTPVIDFGQYAGWRIAEVADHDPRYLVWLSRHSSGMRFRSVIEQVLGFKRDLGRQAAVLG